LLNHCTRLLQVGNTGDKKDLIKLQRRKETEETDRPKKNRSKEGRERGRKRSR
jgi:hypothetical protein